MQIMELSLNHWLTSSFFFFFFAIHSPFLSSIDLSGKDNRHIDLQAQQLAWFTHQFRLILNSPVKEEDALTDG